MKRIFTFCLLTVCSAISQSQPADAAPETALPFTGYISVVSTLGGTPRMLLYTVSTNSLRIEVAGSSRPDPVNLVDLGSGSMIIAFPHNRSFIKLKPAAEFTAGSVTPAGMPTPPQMPQMPAGAGSAGPGMRAIPVMPMPGEKLELKGTGEKTNLLGCACERFELKQRGEVMEIWATDQLLPFHDWQPNQRPRFGLQMMEERWGDLLRAKKVFPLLAVLKFENGPERLRFEVKTMTPKKIEDPDGVLFQPPAGYQELQLMPL